MFAVFMWVCYLVCSPVHPSLSARVDVDEHKPLNHVRVVQLKQTHTNMWSNYHKILQVGN